MIYVDNVRCNGCGECVGVCRAGAIALLGDKAFIEDSLCDECEKCIDVCPQGAIISVEVIEPAVSTQMVPVPTPAAAEIASAPPQPALPSLREWALPTIGSALLWTGREIVPRLASLALDLLDRRSKSSAGRALPRQRPQDYEPPLKMAPGTEECGQGRRRRRLQRRQRHRRDS